MSERRPQVDAAVAAALAAEHFGVRGRARELPGDRERNFRIDGEDGRRFSLKVAPAAEERPRLLAQHQAMRAVAERAPEIGCPRPVAGRQGEEIVEAGEYLVRLLTWVEGVPLAGVRPRTDELLTSAGELLGRVDRALAGLSLPPPPPGFAWELARAPETVAERCGALAGDAGGDAGGDAAELVGRGIETFAGQVLPRLDSLAAGPIHNDGNDHNVLVGPAEPGPLAARRRRAVGLLDFGDMVFSRRIFGPAVGAAYALLGRDDPLRAAAALVRGWHSRDPIPEEELPLLLPCIRARLCLSVTVAADQRRQEPDNAYLSVSERDALRALGLLDRIDPDLAHATFRDACGLPALPHRDRVVAFLRRCEVAPVLGADWQGRSKRVLDLSPAGEDSMEDEVDGPAIGRYDEPRLCYDTDAFAGEEPDDRRTVHAGLDLFAPAGTPVHAPVDGVVHSLAVHRAPRDYGPAVVLEHATAEGAPFYTLYGHLAEDSIAGLEPGRPVARGEAFARLGCRRENGGWPPHLHLQMMLSMLGKAGDFPGAVAARQRSLWLGLCPDPNLLARLPEAAPFAWPDPEELLRRRRAHLPANLSLTYGRPLHFVRGRGQFLIDGSGRAWLDAVNNVPHVGHCHPRVVAALHRQARRLATNTRYLHEEILRLAEALTATMPEPLSVCFFVNSGSEANELALRLARTHTGRRDVVVLEAGYHGNTGALIELSHYKFAGPGGAGRAPHVHVAPLPDPYRSGLGAGDLAEGVGAALARAAERGGACALLVEPLPGCGGQIVPPPGWLTAAFARARAAGALCIADEVQVGLGRVGRAFWAFGLDGALPDVVTIGKPLGNGHPLAAVVTTPEIAASFDTGMEWFNTFGGNPVSCAVGNAVLEVIAEEGLQERARQVGGHLLAGLRELQQRHAVIGDVRGEGLFAGVELVTDRDRKTPAAAQAAYAVERLRDFGVLTSTDGPLHNVIKIKPPLVFTTRDAEALLEALDTVLAEDAARKTLL